MGDILERLPEGSRIAVIRLRSLGDCVLTTPALTLLRGHRPDLKVAVVVEERFRGVFEDNPDVAALLSPELGSLRAWRPRLVLNLHGGARSMWMTAASGAPLRAGFGHHSFRFIYNAPIPRAQEILGEERPVHTAEHLASAMFWLGVPRQEIPRAQLFAPVRRDGPAQPYAVLHPFASAPEKAWPAERFRAVADELRKSGLEVAIVGGPDDDVGPFSAFAVYHNAPLAQIKSLLAGAQIFIGNDSGPAHMAAAFGVPVVVLFGPSNPITWAPWRTEAQVLTAPAGLEAITVPQVLAAAGALRVRA
jgi:ADP-heptose:LPS heptosyltransferase